MWEWLLEKWNSLESVTTFSWWMSFFAISFALLTALFGVFLWLVDNQRDYLKTLQEQKLSDPWKLSTQQREQFVAILSEVPSHIEIDLPVGEPYSQKFATELGILFTDAGWTINLDSNRSLFEPPLYGIKLELDLYIESEEDQEMGVSERSIIERAFNTVGIRLENTEVYRNINPVPRKFIRLYVGHRPQSPK
jgi:hypothetical protein